MPGTLNNLALPLAVSLFSPPLASFLLFHRTMLSPAPGPLHLLAALPGTCVSLALCLGSTTPPLDCCRNLMLREVSFLLPLSKLGPLVFFSCHARYACFHLAQSIVGVLLVPVAFVLMSVSLSECELHGDRRLLPSARHRGARHRRALERTELLPAVSPGRPQRLFPILG